MIAESLAGDVGSERGFALGYRVNDGDSGHGATRTTEQSPKPARFMGSSAPSQTPELRAQRIQLPRRRHRMAVTARK